MGGYFRSYYAHNSVILVIMTTRCRQIYHQHKTWQTLGGDNEKLETLAEENRMHKTSLVLSWQV